MAIRFDQGDDDAPAASRIVKWGGLCAGILLLLLVGYYVVSFALSFIAAPTVGDISGKVYLNNSPLNSGMVSFFPRSGKQVQCSIQSDGRYEAKNVEFGELIVTVVQPNPKYKSKGQRRKEAKGKLEDRPPDDGEPEHLLPEIYRDSTTSPLKFTLDKRSATYEIRVDSE
jgi:hypothetical protein